MKKVLILTRTCDQQKFFSEVKNLWLKDIEIVAPDSHEWILEHIIDCHVIYGIPYLINEYIHLAQNLEWVQSTFAWVDALMQKDLRQDYILTNVKDVYGAIMAEYVLWYILLHEKNILWNIENQKNKDWDQKSYPSLDRKTIGIMGTGSIGRHIAKVLSSLWMNVIWYSSSTLVKEYFSEMYDINSIGTFLEKSDYVVSVLPNTQATNGIINESVFSAMKPTAIFISIGRGANVVEDDLVEAINTKKIAWAVLDVFQLEPLPKDSKLWELENVFITPHVSWYDDNNEPILEIFSGNYKRFIQWEELLHQIDFNKGY